MDPGAFREMLDRQPGVTVLQLRRSTALVEMSEGSCRDLQRDYPDLIIEREIRYDLA
jgi:hypothetical protein